VLNEQQLRLRLVGQTAALRDLGSFSGHDLDEIEARADRAAPGPWRPSGSRKRLYRDPACRSVGDVAVIGAQAQKAGVHVGRVRKASDMAPRVNSEDA